MADSLISDVRIYVINLDRSPQRLEEITKQLSNFDLTFQRITATDGKLATPQQKALLDEGKYHLKHGKTSLPGELGCYLSHVEAISEFLKSDNLFAVILEDDAIIENGFVQVLQHLAHNSKQWDMVKLSGVHSGTPASVQRINEYHRLSVMFSKCTGSSAYMINRHAAQSYIDKLLPMTLPYDHEFDKGWSYNIKVRAVTPFVVSHNVQATTTIETTHIYSRKFPGAQRWPTYLYRMQTELHRVRYAIGQYFST
jgi:glycosyl transferase family 25